MSSQDKSPDAFRTISEVADDLDLPQHVLRFWETRFSHIKPLKRGGGRRYYRPDDVELLRGIRHLLYGEGYTIKGVQRILKEQGPRFVMQVWRADGLPVPAVARSVDPADYEPDSAQHRDRSPAPPMTAPVQVATEALPKGLLAEGELAPSHASAKSASGLKFMDRFRGHADTEIVHAAPQTLSRDDVRRLQSTLFELLECKRILDQAR